MAVLHNRVSQEELKKLLYEETEHRITVSFYQYFFIDNDFYISSIKEMDTKEFNGAPLSVDEFGNYLYNTQYKNSSSFNLNN